MRKYVSLKGYFPLNLFRDYLIYVDVLDANGKYIVLREIDKKLGIKYSYTAYREPNGSSYYALILSYPKKYSRNIKSIIVNSDRLFDILGYSAYAEARRRLNDILKLV